MGQEQSREAACILRGENEPFLHRKKVHLASKGVEGRGQHEYSGLGVNSGKFFFFYPSEKPGVRELVFQFCHCRSFAHEPEFKTGMGSADDCSDGDEIHDPLFVAEPACKEEGWFSAARMGLFSKDFINPVGRSEDFFFWDS